MTAPFKTLTAITLSATIAFTTAASADTRSYPHQHTGRDAQTANNQAIGGLIALLALGAFVSKISSDDDDDDRADRRTARRQAARQARREEAREARREARRAAAREEARREEARLEAERREAKRAARHNRNVLPRECLRSFATDQGPRQLAVQRCLNRNAVPARSLPDQCFRQLETDRGLRFGYGYRCLANRGYRFN